ncbi:hypothetical protein [Marivita sp.]|uniref:hypothetical protein n=1 Tax=Marivita sp. TaxID=2003365 RepID=UPI0025C6D027|nr:hypothetical protein [Marivita sp.]
MKIRLNDTFCNDRSAFDAADDRVVVPADGTYLLGATFLYKVDASTSARMSGRIVLNGTTEIRGSRGEISGAPGSQAAALWLQTMIALTAGDMVKLRATSAPRMATSDPTTPPSRAQRSAEGGTSCPHGAQRTSSSEYRSTSSRRSWRALPRKVRSARSPMSNLCLPVVEHSREFQSRAAGELVLLPEGSAIVEMSTDRNVMREQRRVCG